MTGEEGDDAAPDDDDGEAMPPFLRYGIFTVVVYGVAVMALGELTTVDVGGPTLLSFTAGFLVFMTVYFVSMWVAWLYF